MDIKVVQNRIQILQKAKEEAKLDRIMRAEELQNSEGYRNLTDKINQCKRERDEIVHKNLIVAKYTKKIKELNEEISCLQEILNYELINYHKETDKVQIEDISGHLYSIKFRSTIKPTNQKELEFGDSDAE